MPYTHSPYVYPKEFTTFTKLHSLVPLNKILLIDKNILVFMIKTGKYILKPS